MTHFRPLQVLGNHLNSVQSILAFKSWKGYPQFEDDKGIGRAALLSCILATILGVNLVLCLQLVLIHLGLIPKDIFGGNWSDGTLQMAMQWTVYVILLCTFHLCEFFITAIFNPSVTSADSFMVNHSKAYTAAALLSWIEFGIRILFFDYSSPKIFCIGIIFVLGGQLCRSWAMVTCGESFNHYIQRDKKENHILVTNGIYGIFRHPSYVGFFYWSVGTQLVLCNPISTIIYAIAAWTFFRYRICYEEEILRNLFPRYESYAARSYIGIPFIRLALRFDDKGQ